MPAGWRRRASRGRTSSDNLKLVQRFRRKRRPSLSARAAIANYSQQGIVLLREDGARVQMAVESIEGGLKQDGWNRPRGNPSLSEVFGSIRTRPTGSFWRKLTAFLGPGYLVAVGYMDTGNWATSPAGGSQ